MGYVWATMLWDLTWALIDEYGYDADVYNGNGGNNLAIQLVTDGLKMQPCSPGFVQGRDAILAADQALTGGENERLIWQVFARRGLGYSADQGSAFDRTDGCCIVIIRRGTPAVSRTSVDRNRSACTGPPTSSPRCASDEVVTRFFLYSPPTRFADLPETTEPEGDTRYGDRGTLSDVPSGRVAGRALDPGGPARAGPGTALPQCYWQSSAARAAPPAAGPCRLPAASRARGGAPRARSRPVLRASPG